MGASSGRGRKVGRMTARERILDAAVRRIAREGIDEVRIARIATDAGVSPSLVHYHFDSRDALLAEALEHSYERAGDRADRARRRGVTPAASASAAMIDQCLPAPGALQDDFILWVELWLRAARRPELRATSARLYGPLHDWFAARRRGERGAGIDPDASADHALALCDGYGIRVLSRGSGDAARARRRRRVARAGAVELERSTPAESPRERLPLGGRERAGRPEASSTATRVASAPDDEPPPAVRIVSSVTTLVRPGAAQRAADDDVAGVRSQRRAEVHRDAGDRRLRGARRRAAARASRRGASSRYARKHRRVHHAVGVEVAAADRPAATSSAAATATAPRRRAGRRRAGSVDTSSSSTNRRPTRPRARAARPRPTMAVARRCRRCGRDERGGLGRVPAGQAASARRRRARPLARRASRGRSRRARPAAPRCAPPATTRRATSASSRDRAQPDESR